MTERSIPYEFLGGTAPLLVRRIPYRSDLIVMAVSGEVDLRTAPLLAQAFNGASPPVTVVDLTRVTFLSAAGLRVLVHQAKQALAEHHCLGLVAGDSIALRVLRTSGVAAYIPTFGSLSDAVRELGPRATDQT